MLRIIFMKRLKSNLSLNLLLFAAVSLIIKMPLYGNSKIQNKSGPGSRLWSQLLVSFENHTEESRHFVAEVLESKKFLLETKLAQVLLNEWYLDTKSDRFRGINIVYTEPFEAKEMSEIGVTHIPSAVVMKIDVDSKGKFINGTFLKLKKDEFIKEKRMIINSLKKSCFRPPFVKGKFTSGSGIVTIYLH